VESLTRSDFSPTCPIAPSSGPRKASGVSESDFLFDTWAWWEYLHGSAVGTSLRDRYVLNKRFRVHTSAITLGELSAKLTSDGAHERVAPACGAIRRLSHIWDVTSDIAQEAGPAREELRQTAKTASLADALILVTSRRAGARLVSGDPAFAGVAGVISR
jgi:predicted nucleic acid-binding protein